MPPNLDGDSSKQRLLDLEQMLNKRLFTLREIMDFMFKDLIKNGWNLHQDLSTCNEVEQLLGNTVGRKFLMRDLISPNGNLLKG